MKTNALFIYLALATTLLGCTKVIEDPEHLKELCVAVSKNELLLDGGKTLLPSVELDIRTGGRYKVIYMLSAGQKHDESRFSGDILDIYSIAVVPFNSDTTNLVERMEGTKDPVTLDQIWTGGGFLNATISSHMPAVGDSLYYQLEAVQGSTMLIDMAYLGKEKAAGNPVTFSCRLSDITQGRDVKALIVKVLELEDGNATVKTYNFTF